MQKTFILYLFIITNIFICVSCNSMPVKEQEKVVSLPDWEKKNIANPWFDNWGSLIVENQNNYFYATSKGIMRIDKQTGKETLIVEKESKEMQLCIGEKSLYYIVPEEKKFISSRFFRQEQQKTFMWK